VHTRLLIVDDHALVREGLVRLLSGQPGLEIVGEAAGVADGLEFVCARDPDVVLLDITLADGSGLDLIEPILKRRPGIRVLMLTMHAEPEYAEMAIERGAMGLVSKAATVGELVEAIVAARCGEILRPEGTLTAREREILSLVGGGETNAEISERLSISHKTVEGHVQRIMAKLGIHTRAGLVAYAHRADFEQEFA